MPGVFVTRGMRVQIPVGGLVVSMTPEGHVDSQLSLEVSLDMCPYWLELAVEHLAAAAAARADVLAARSGDNEATVGTAIEREFAAGMQALTSAAIGLDALYASVRERTTLPDSLVTTWRKNRTARAKQVAEVFRRAFRIGPKGFRNLSAIVTELYRFRNMAVHPPATFSAPVFHPILNAGTEWRFVSFGHDSARVAVRASLAAVSQLASRPRAKNELLARYCADLSVRLAPLVERWQVEFGPLLDTTDTSGAQRRQPDD